MGWFRRRRARDARVVFVGADGRPAALPPLPDFLLAILAEPAPVPPPAPAEPPYDGPAVHLGFTDGSEVVLPPDDPTARALCAAADAITRPGG